MIKAVIFDFDGTLIDTNQLIYEGLQFLSMRYKGEQTPMPVLKALAGKPLTVQLSAVHPEKVDIMESQFQIWYRHNHHQKARLFPGISEMLSKLEGENLSMAIVTNNNRETLLMGLEHLGILNYFDHHITRDDVAVSKPSPEGLLKSLTRLNLRPDEVLFVGDTENDVLAAENAGVASVYVGWSEVDPRAFERMPDFIIHHPDELLMLIQKYAYRVA